MSRQPPRDEALAALQDQSFARRGSAEVVADVLNTQVADVLTSQRAAPAVIIGCRRPRVFLGLVLVRYRYRLCPSPGQRQSLTQVFGCARVVYNDCLRLREECHAAGVKISAASVQRRVITLAKLTPERQWLATAPSVALVQACNDARRAYRNYFDSRSGKRKGRKIGHPRFRSKRGRQSIRLTRNGFSLRGERLYVAKVGQIKLRWSRPLPSRPSSVTVIREPDGRYYASFVVERPPTPLPPSDCEVGVDVGLARLAVTSGGEVIANPRFLRARQRRLAKAQRALSRKQKGSANRAKARHRVAVLHRKVQEARLDHAHKTALWLVRDNQAVYAEDLAVSGLARTRLPKSVHDAGWASCCACWPKGAALRARVLPGWPVRAHLPDVLGVRRQRRPQAAERAGLDVRCLRRGARPRRQRRTEHPRRRAGGEAKRLWRRRKSTARGGGSR